MSQQAIKQTNLILITISVFFIIIKWSVLPPQIPLFYSRPWGQEQLAPKFFIFILPAVSFLVFLVNNLFAEFFLKRGSDFFVKASLISSFIVSLLCLISLVKIIILIT